MKRNGRTHSAAFQAKVPVEALKDEETVAQPGSAPEWVSGGQMFKSSHPDQFSSSH